jgi:hypothetical protein
MAVEVNKVRRDKAKWESKPDQEEEVR